MAEVVSPVLHQLRTASLGELPALESQRTGLSVFYGECHHRWATCQIDLDPIHWAVRHVDIAFGDAHLGTQAISRDL